MNTIISIPGRETQTISGLSLTKSQVIASFAGDIDLSGMDATETTSGDTTTIAFSNRTGTKGNDVTVNIENVNVSGDLVVNTRILIPGREAQVIPGIKMTGSQVIAAYATDLDLSSMELSEYDESSEHVVAFTTRTGTKGADINDIFNAIQSASNVTVSAGNVTAGPAPEAATTSAAPQPGTTIVIPGREDQFIPDMVLDAQMVKDSFSSEIDLSGYNVEETDQGNGRMEVRFTARTGTKG